MPKGMTAGLLAVAMSACAAVPATGDACRLAAPIGRFDPANDVLIAMYDGKPDVDDLHAVASLGTVLADPDYACVQYVAVAGAYGTQGGDYIAAPALFDLAFGAHWLDAHASRQATIATLAGRITATLAGGGEVWILEAGQSDVSAAAIGAAHAAAPEQPYRSHVHVIQHSEWNEQASSPDALAYVKLAVDYHRIPDGNAEGNGSPGFRTESADAWGALLGNPETGALWAEAKRLADLHNGKTGYDNPAVKAGGLDFSDTSEAAWLFGFEDMPGVTAFVDRFSPAR